MQKITVDINRLESMKNAITQLKEIFLSRDTEDSYKVTLNPDTPCSEEIYSVSQFLQDCECPIEDELLLFLTAAQYPDTRDLMIEFIEQISYYNKHQNKSPLMINSEMPFGFFLALALALHNEKQITYWTEFLKGLDLNHEVYELNAMDALFKVHGITSTMLDLAVERVLLPGQFGWDQVGEWLAPWKDHHVFAEFLKRLADTTCQSFIEDGTKYQSHAKARLLSMNCFLSGFYAANEPE